MSDRNRKNFGLSKRTSDRGSRPNSAHASGRNTPDPRSSSQPIGDPHFGDQPTPDPRSSDENIPNLRHITTPHRGGQRAPIPRPSTAVPSSSGQRTPVPSSSSQRTTVPRASMSIPRSSSQSTAKPHLSLQSTPAPRSSRKSTPNLRRTTAPHLGGQHTPVPSSSGRRIPVPRSSGQPSAGPHLGVQPTPRPRSSGQDTPKLRRITDPRHSGKGATVPHSGGQSTLVPRSSESNSRGQLAPVSVLPINNGIYIITNVKHGTLVFLPDPNHRTPLQGHFRRNIPGELWRVEERVKQRYLIQSLSHKSFANSGPRAQVGDSVEGDSKEQLWRIQECSEGNFMISTTDTKICWALPQEELETPVELSSAYTDPKCWWTFTKLADDGYAETAIISETGEASPRRLQGGTGTVAQGQIYHPSTSKDVRDELEMQRETPGSATKSIRDSEDFRILERLKPVDAPSYRDDRGCMEGTRTALLDHLVAWTLEPTSQDSLTNGSNAANIYWLYGSPGLGKTSIANSLCERLHGSRTLGGSFFCRRDDPVMREPRAILPTLIFKLAEMWDPYRKLVVQALRDDPQLNPESKRGEVLVSLLRSVQKYPSHTLVLVVDAVDECGDPDAQKSLLMCLLEACSRISWIKVVITSRPEHDIKTFFEQNRVRSRDLAEDDQTLEDIRLFTRHRMSRIASRRYLPTDWPGEGRLKQIIDRSGGLFIFVETVCRLADDPDPDPRLAEVLDGELVEANAELYNLYSMAILSRIGKSKEKFRSFARAVVLVATYRPLPDETLASLMGIECGVVCSWVDGLGAILYRDASTNGGIRVRHLSVIDFLTGPACPEEFRVVLGQANEEMGVRCLATMAKELKFNICELETSCVLNADIPDLDNRVQDKISDALQYSSMHWSSHLCSDSAPASIAVSELLDAFLRGTHQLYWVEVMSLMGKVPVAISSMRLMKACFRKFEDRHQRLVEDALRFLLAFFAPISTSTPHIYLSALPFTPVESDISKHARVSFPEMIDVCKGRAESWPAPSSIWLGHTNSVRGVAYSPDGLNVVSGSDDNTIRIWDAQTGAAVGQPLTGHILGINSVAYSPDGQNVVSGSSDNTIRIWDAQTGAAVGQPLIGHGDEVRSVAYSPDGRNVVSGSDDNTIRIWDAQTGAAVGQQLRGHTRSVNSVAYSPDGQNVVSGSDDNTIRIWDVQTGAAVGQPLTGHTGWVYSVAYSPDGRNVVSGSSDNTIRIWDAYTGAAVGQPLIGHTWRVCSVAYSPDGRNVISGSDDNTIRIWDAQTGAAVGQPLIGHGDYVRSVAYSPDGRNVVSGSDDNTIRIWDAQTGAAVGQPLTGHTGLVFSVAYSPDGQNVISRSDDNTTRIWDAQTGAAVGQPLIGHGGYVRSFAYSPDGLNVVSGSDKNTIRIWDARTGAAVGQPLTGHTGAVSSVTYSPDGQNVVSGSSDNTIRIWDAQTGAAVGQPLTGHTGRILSIAYSPNGQNVISGSSDDKIRIWNAQTGAAVGQPLIGHSDYVQSVAYSPDGRNVVSGSDDNTIRIWDVQTEAAVGQPLTGHTKSVMSVAYSPDGQNVVSGSGDNTIRIWDAPTGTGEGRGDVISHSSYSFTNHLSLTAFSGCPIPTALLDPDGWVHGAEGLLFWVPEDCRNGLTCPAIMTIPNTGRQRSVRIDFTRFQYGTSWKNIRGGIQGEDYGSISSV